MKIVLDCTYLRNTHTGVDEYFFGLIQDILDIDGVNKYIIFVDSRYKLDNLFRITAKATNTKIIRIYSPLPLQIFYTTLIAPFYLILNKIDVYHNPYMFGPLFRIPRCKTKTIITVHDLFYKTIPKLRNKYMNIVFKLFAENAIKKADKVIVISEQTKRDVIEYLNIRVRKITLIHQALRNVPENLSLEENVFGDYILTVGSLLPSKGMKDLINAFSLFTENTRNNGLCLIHAGMHADTNHYQEIMKMINDKKLDQRIKILGYVGEDELHNLYSHAQIVIMPSFYEGFGFPVLEAMKYNVPVIARNVSSLIEVVGDAGLLFNTTDELACMINILIDDEKLRTELIEKGKTNLIRFSSVSRAEKTLECYFEK